MSAALASRPDGACLLPALRINVENPSSCLPGGYIPPPFQSLFVDSKRSSSASYVGSALPGLESLQKHSTPELELPCSKNIVWSPPVMPLRCTAAQLQRWWTSGASTYEFIPPENTQLKAQVEALCSGNVGNLEREREQADPFRDVVASERRVFGIPECVAYAQLDVECGFLLPAKDRLFFAEVCGVGAFAEFVMTRRGKAAKGWMMRSAGDDAFSPARMNTLARTLLSAHVDTKYATSDSESRSLLQESLRLEIIDHVLAVSGNGLDVVAAAWTPEIFKDKARSVGAVCARFVSQLLLALDLCAQGGTLLVRLFTSTDPVVLGVIPLVASCFESSAIVKPLATSPYSAVRFLVCRGMMQRINETSGIRATTSAFLTKAIKHLESGDPAWLCGPSPLCTPPLATKFVAQANDSIDAVVVRMWTRAAALKSGNGVSEKDQRSIRPQLLAKLSSWAVPDKSLLQQKHELKQLGLDVSEIEALGGVVRNSFMNSGRLAQLQANQVADARPSIAVQQQQFHVAPPPLVIAPRAPESAPPHRPHPVTAAPVTQSAKVSSSSSAPSSNASKKKKNDAEAFLDANELGGSESSVLPSPSKQPPSNNVASRLQTSTSQADATSAAAPKATAPKVAAKPIPAPLLAAAKKAGMSVAHVSSKTGKAAPAPLPTAASAAEVPISNPSQSAAFATSSSKEVQIVSIPAVASAIASRTETEHEVTTKVIEKAVDIDDIGRTTSSNSTPSIPLRRKRVVQSDDSDDAPSTPASRQPNTAAAASSSDAPIVTAASPALDSSAKKPRVSILSSRASSAVTADVAATVEESVDGHHEVEELLVSKAAAAVAGVSAAVPSDTSAPAKSGLRIALKRRIAD